MMASHMLFLAEQMNWDLMQIGAGEWLSTRWVVYADGTVEESSRFDADEDNPVVATKRYKYDHVTVYRMQDEQFAAFCALIDEAFDGVTLSAGMDGIGWHMESYREGGSLRHAARGYAEDSPIAEKITEILLSLDQE